MLRRQCCGYHRWSSALGCHCLDLPLFHRILRHLASWHQGLMPAKSSPSPHERGLQASPRELIASPISLWPSSRRCCWLSRAMMLIFCLLVLSCLLWVSSIFCPRVSMHATISDTSYLVICLVYMPETRCVDLEQIQSTFREDKASNSPFVQIWRRVMGLL